MNKRYSGGFVAILGLMIVIMILIFLMAGQYQKMAVRNHNVIDKETLLTGTPVPGTPIDRAWDAKDALEERDRQMQ